VTHRRTGGAEPRPRVLLALLAVLLVLISGTGALTGAGSAGAAPAQAATPSVELRGQTPFVAPKDTLELRLALRDVPADATLSFEVQFPITSTNASDPGTPRAKLDRSISGKTQGRFQVPKSVQTAFVPTDADGVATVKLEIQPEAGPEPEFGFRLADGGVYPLVVTLAGGDQAPLASFITYLIRLPEGAPAADAPPLKVAGILPFRAPLAINTQGQSTLDSDGIKRLSEITRIAKAHSATPLTIAPNAETVAALGLLGDRAAANTPAALASAWTGHEVLTSTFVPLDIDAWMASKMTDELRQQLRLGRDTISGIARAAQPFDLRTWLADPTLAATSLHELQGTGRDRAVLPPDSVAPLDPKVVKPEQAQVLNLEPFDIETEGTRTRAVITEDTFRSRFSATANPALNAQIAMADLAVLYFGAERPLTSGGTAPVTRPRSVTAVLPEDLKSLAAVDAFLEALNRPVAEIVEGGGRPIIEPATVDTVLSGEPAPVNPSATTTPSGTPAGNAGGTPRGTAAPTPTTAPTPPPTAAGTTPSTTAGAPGTTNRPVAGGTVATAAPEAAPAFLRTYTPRGSLGETTMGTYPERLAAARVSLAGYDSMVGDVDAGRVTSLEQLIDVSGSAQLSPQERQAYLDAATASVARTADAVRPLPQENVTITESRTELALPIQNDNAYPVDIRVSLTSDKMQFPDGDAAPANSRSFVTTLQPGLNKVPVEVSANTSGEIQVTSKLTSPDEHISLATSRFTVRSTLISGLGLALSIGAGFFLLVWWARNFRKTRRANKLVAADDRSATALAEHDDHADPTAAPADSATDRSTAARARAPEAVRVPDDPADLPDR
jgi:hypothetical protein